MGYRIWGLFVGTWLGVTITQYFYVEEMLVINYILLSIYILLAIHYVSGAR